MAETKPLRVALHTFGCKVNLFETEQLKASLASYQLVSEEEAADIHIINGCTVTASTDAQVRQLIRRLARKGGRVIATGCWARKHDRFFTADESITVVPTIEQAAALLGAGFEYTVQFDRARPFIKIQDGCDQCCSYCIIPSVRGKELKSAPLEKITPLLQKMVADGYREVVLTGIHLGKYGAENNYKTTLAEVIAAAHAIVGRVRLSSIEPIEISEAMLTLAREKKLLAHWHIPLQSGSDTVLLRMGRPYSAAQAAEAVWKAHASSREAPGIGTDIIVGYPGETTVEFEETRALIQSLPFTYGHVFPFSPREGTKAAEEHRNHPVPQAVIKERAKELRDIFAAKKKAYLNHNINKTIDMVLETEKEPGIFEGTTDNYLQLHYHGSGSIREVIRVTIVKESGKYFALPV